MIEIRKLSKRYGTVAALDDVTFTVQPAWSAGPWDGTGPGKSASMRIVLGLDRATAGEASVGGRAYNTCTEPMRVVGALLDPGAIHAGRSGRSHLMVAARTNGIARARVEEVIEQVGLGTAAKRRIKGYSLGMRQRLGIATALLGDPKVLMFDEPMNGLDLDGVLWIRNLLRQLADQGRSVLISSHLMSEMQQTADRLVVIGQGRVIADATTQENLEGLGNRRVRVGTSQAAELLSHLLGHGLSARRAAEHDLEAHVGHVPLDESAGGSNAVREACQQIAAFSLDNGILQRGRHRPTMAGSHTRRPVPRTDGPAERTGDRSLSGHRGHRQQRSPADGLRA